MCQAPRWQVLEERVSGVTTARYVWSPVYVDALVLRDRDTNADGTPDERLYAVQDANWNVVALVDTTGAVVERYSYSPYGERTVLTPTYGARASSSYGFTIGYQGRPRDEVSGTDDYRTRIYLYSLGRFGQMDSGGYAMGDVNLYRFEGNRPTGMVDPSGMQGILDELGMIGGYVVRNPVGAYLNFQMGQLDGANDMFVQPPRRTGQLIGDVIGSQTITGYQPSNPHIIDMRNGDRSQAGATVSVTIDALSTIPVLSGVGRVVRGGKAISRFERVIAETQSGLSSPSRGFGGLPGPTNTAAVSTALAQADEAVAAGANRGGGGGGQRQDYRPQVARLVALALVPAAGLFILELQPPMRRCLRSFALVALSIVAVVKAGHYRMRCILMLTPEVGLVLRWALAISKEYRRWLAHRAGMC